MFKNNYLAVIYVNLLRINVLLNHGCRYKNWSDKKQKGGKITKKRRNQNGPAQCRAQRATRSKHTEN